MSSFARWPDYSCAVLLQHVPLNASTAILVIASTQGTCPRQVFSCMFSATASLPCSCQPVILRITPVGRALRVPLNRVPRSQAMRPADQAIDAHPVGIAGIEPATSCSQGKHPTTGLYSDDGHLTHPYHVSELYQGNCLTILRMRIWALAPRTSKLTVCESNTLRHALGARSHATGM
jgi:hypothetical protein